MRSVELFAGAGGLAIAMSNAGFRHAAVVERNHDACETFRENQRLHLHEVNKWPLYEGDVQDFDYRELSDVAVVSGGPPCQPFSLGGKHRGHSDKRDMFPEAVRAVHELRPKAFLFENVKGLMRETFASYFEYILLRFAHPSVTRRKSESPRDHCARLERHHTSRRTRTEYNVVFRLLNAADFGVPQRRERVFIVGFRSDLGVQWSFPEGDHSEDTLLHSKWVTGEYWDRHRLTKRRRPELPARLMARVQRLSIASKPMQIHGGQFGTQSTTYQNLSSEEARRSPTTYSIPVRARILATPVARSTNRRRHSRRGITACPEARTCWPFSTDRCGTSPCVRQLVYKRFQTTMCFAVPGPNRCVSLETLFPCS